MARKDAQRFARRSIKPPPLFNLGLQKSEGLLSARKALLENYEKSMRVWFARVQAEASLWSELPAKMAGSGSVANALEVYSDCVSRQLQMSAEDGQQFFDDCRRIASNFANSLGGKRSMTGE
jgi:hypothetical protein